MATFKASLSVAPSEQRSCERTAILLDHMQQKHHKPFEVPGLAQEVLSELPRLKAPAYGNPIWPAYAVASELMRKANGSPNMHAQLSNQLLSKLPAIAVHNPSAAHGLFRAVLDEHVAQLLGYLKSARVAHGLLINFGSYKFEIRKFVRSEPRDDSHGALAMVSALFAFFAVK